MELNLLHACMIGPMPLVELLSTLLQRGRRPAFPDAVSAVPAVGCRALAIGGVAASVSTAINGRKSTDQTGAAEEQKSIPR